MSLPEDLRVAILREAEGHGGPRGGMLEALRMIQQAEGWVSDAHLAECAELLGVPTAELEGLATFYSLIFRKPVGDTVILLCDAASCWMSGADAVRDALMQRLGIGFGETTEDGRFTLLNICCVGGCDRAPAAVVGPDRKLMGPLSADAIDELLEGAS